MADAPANPGAPPVDPGIPAAEPVPVPDGFPLAGIPPGNPMPALLTFQNVLTQVLNLTQRQIACLVSEGFTDFREMHDWDYDEIKEWAAEKTKLPANRANSATFGVIAVKRLQALGFWVNDLIKRGQPIDPNAFTDQVMRDMIVEAKTNHQESKAKSEVEMPEKFKYEKWETWEETVVNYLNSQKGISGLPLSYITRKTEPPFMMTRYDEVIYNAALDGPIFTADNRTVAQLLLPLVLDTDAYEWCSSHLTRRRGRDAWLALTTHYNGKAEGDRRLTGARDTVERLFYRSETSFTFEKFSTKLKAAFDTLDKYGEPKSDREKVAILLKKVTNDKLNSAVTLCRQLHPEHFGDAVSYLATEVSVIFPAFQPGGSGSKNRNRGNRRVASIIRKNGVITSFSGIDLSDTTRFFKKDEWSKLMKNKEVSKFLLNCPKRKAALEAKKKRKRETSALSTDNSTDQENHRTRMNNEIAATVITGVMNAQATNTETGSLASNSIPTQVQMPQAGRHANTVSATNSSSRTVRVFDHNGNITGTRNIGKVITGPRVRRTERKVYNQKRKYNPESSTLEIDSHADTHCFGSNFRVIRTTNTTCSVSPFLDDLGSSDNVEIVTGATAYTDELGQVHILVFGQGLDFTDRMDKSLINPYQCRAFGVDVVDDPTDPSRTLGMYPDKEHFPLKMEGTTCLMDTRCPTEIELSSCPHYILSDERDWDPTNVQFNVSSTTTHQLEEEIHPNHHDSMFNFSWINSLPRQISMIESSLPEPNPAPTTTPLPRNPHFCVNAISSNERHHSLTPQNIAKKFMISEETAIKTINSTTFKAMRTATGFLQKRYKSDIAPWSRFRQLKSTMFTDPLISKLPSLRGNKMAQVYTDGKFITAIPMRAEGNCGDTLYTLGERYGLPSTLVSDNAKAEVSYNSSLQKACRQLRVISKSIEPYTPSANKAEGAMRQLKSKIKRRMVKRNIPRKLWDFVAENEAAIISLTARGDDGRPGLESLTGDSVDISEYVDFEMYDLVWFWENPGSDENPLLGRYLGPAHNVGPYLCYWVLKDNGKIFPRTTVQHVTRDESLNPEIQEMIRKFDANIQDVFKSGLTLSDEDFEDYIFDRDSTDTTSTNEESYVGLPEEGDIEDFIGTDKDEEALDGYIGAELLLPQQDGSTKHATVKKRKTLDGIPIGKSNNNPFLDTREYEVQLTDGSTLELTANQIAENMIALTNAAGQHYQLIDEIIDHKSDGNAIPVSEGTIETKTGNIRKKITTAGWKLLVQWKDGSSDWVPLKDLKNSNPVHLAQYAVANKIDHEPAFSWWVKDVLRRTNRIISKTKKYWRTTHKFGIRIPKTADEALQIDRETGTDYWAKAIEKEMKNVRVAFDVRDDISIEEARSGKKLVGYQEIGCHMIFDIKMDGLFTRKARLVAGGHTTDPPAAITYSSVVSRESVRIAFTLAALNGLDIWACDIGNAYLNADCREKIWTVTGTEFGSDKGKVALVVRALYGLKSSGAAWRALLAETLVALGYTSTKADPDVWIKSETTPNGHDYYAIVLVYVDDMIHMHHNPQGFMKQVNEVYRLKDGYGRPDRYLGANIERVELSESGDILWSATCRDYVHSAIKNLEETLEAEGKSLKSYSRKSQDRPFPSHYKPEVDVSPVLTEELHSRYLQLIGILRWSVELGRIDIITEVSVLSQHQCQPRNGHLDAIYRIFWYLKGKLKSKKYGRIVFDGSEPIFDERLFPTFNKNEWNDFYPDAEEAIPPNAPPPRGPPVVTSCWVDADHAGNILTRRSHTGFIIYLQNTPIIWFSKRQNTVESSSFGSEFIALRIAIEHIIALRYKLRMFGIELRGPTNVFCDNQSVSRNSNTPTSMLNKKHNAICYHKVREAQAAEIIRVAWIEGEYNKADIATKTTLSTKRKHEIIDTIFWDEGVQVIDEKKLKTE